MSCVHWLAEVRKFMADEHSRLRRTVVGDPKRLTGRGNTSSNLLGGFDRKDVSFFRVRETAPTLQPFKSSNRRYTSQVNVRQWSEFLSCQVTAERAIRSQDVEG